jgi:hypothetical protein
MDGLISYVYLYDLILNEDIPVFIIDADFDQMDGPVGTQAWMKQLEWEEMPKFHEENRKLYYYESDDKDIEDHSVVKIGGFYKNYKNLNFVIVHAAGHLVAATQLAITRSFLKDLISDDHTLQCHSIGGDECSVVDEVCELMNGCSDHGKCNSKGKCECSKGWYTADCSVKPTDILTDFTLPPRNWVHFKAKKGVQYEIQASVGRSNTVFSEVHMYTKEGEIPSPHFYDTLHKGIDFFGVTNAEASNLFISFYNPHHSLTTPVTLEVNNNKVIYLASFWIFIVLLILFVISLAVVAVLWVKIIKMRKRRNGTPNEGSANLRLLETKNSSD